MELVGLVPSLHAYLYQRCVGKDPRLHGDWGLTVRGPRGYPNSPAIATVRLGAPTPDRYQEHMDQDSA